MSPNVNGCKFLSRIFHIGQDRKIFRDDPMVRYPHLRMEHVTRMVVHIAVDQNLPDHVLLFNNSFATKIGAEPTHSYNVGLLPVTANYIYQEIPENDSHVKCIQQYVRLFHALHTNNSG